jgi:hypothetical protein
MGEGRIPGHLRLTHAGAGREDPTHPDAAPASRKNREHDTQPPPVTCEEGPVDLPDTPPDGGAACREGLGADRPHALPRARTTGLASRSATARYRVRVPASCASGGCPNGPVSARHWGRVSVSCASRGCHPAASASWIRLWIPLHGSRRHGWIQVSGTSTAARALLDCVSVASPDLAKVGVSRLATFAPRSAHVVRAATREETGLSAGAQRKGPVRQARSRGAAWAPRCRPARRRRLRGAGCSPGPRWISSKPRIRGIYCGPPPDL